MSPPGAIRSFWYKWKSLKLPWRKRWLVGRDLSGTTFWEFHNALNPARPRRIAQYPSSMQHSEVVLAPAWIQWLRHTRPAAPSIEEQHLEVQRQEQLKMLASRADERWEAQERWLDSPAATEQAKPQLKPGSDRDPFSAVAADKPKDDGQEQQPDPQQKRDVKKEEEEENPWKQQRGGPSERWQPAAWNPNKMESR